MARSSNASRSWASTAHLVVPTLSLYEVFKRVLQQRGEGPALQVVAAMHQGTVVDLTSPVALAAAHVSIELGLPMADSIMLATARAWDATFWSQDADFANVPAVRYIAERGRGRAGRVGARRRIGTGRSGRRPA